ncbi:hypothetical protein E2320_014336, partial [Naja naja]
VPLGLFSGSSSHSLKFIYFAILEPSQGLFDFIGLGYVDSQIIGRYDSNSKKIQPRVSWMEKLREDIPQYLQSVTYLARTQDDLVRKDLENMMTHYNMDKETPMVTLSSRMEVEDGMEMHVCRVYGFYPREIDASWMRDGEVWLQDTLHGSVAPNADGTYHYWLSIQIDPKERDRYRCHVEHDSLQEPLHLALKVPGSNLGLIIGCVAIGLVVMCVIVGTSIFFSKESRKIQPRVSWIEKLQEDDPEFWNKVFKEAHDVEKMFTYGLWESRKIQPRVSWIEKLQEDDPEFWNKVFKEAHDVEKMFTYGLWFVRIFSSEVKVPARMPLSVSSEDTSNHNPFSLSGLHMVQILINCDLQGDGSKTGFALMAYNGESMGPPSTMDKSDMEECSALLDKFLSYGNETLLRTEPPVVTVTRRVEAEDGKETHICRVHGFYPRAVNASWTRDGEVWLQDTIHGSVAPNADGTYHYWLSIQIDPEERGHYRCHMEHDGLQESLDMALKGEGRQGGKGWALWQAGGLWERNLTPAVSRCDPT